LEHEGDVELAGGQPQRLLLGVAHQEKPGQPHVDLGTGPAVGVRVEPVRPRAIQNLELVDELAAGAEGEAGVTVHDGRDVEPVPVDDRLLGDLVLEAHPDPLPPAQSKDGA